MEIRMIPCKCPCGTLIPEFDSRGKKRQFVRGHHSRGVHNPNYGKPRSDATKQKIREKQKGKIVSPETKQLISKSKKGKTSPRKGVKLSDATKQLISKNRIGKCCGENNPFFGKTHSPETRQKMRENHADFKGEKSPMFGKTPSDATRQLQSDAHKGMKYSPETKKKRSIAFRGENHPNWQGGVSKLPYCPIWTKWLKKEIKDRDKNQCQNPDCSHKFEKLFVHHIDYDKKNCSTDNLITLCSSCNGRANSNREYWKEIYKKLIRR